MQGQRTSLVQGTTMATLSALVLGLGVLVPRAEAAGPKYIVPTGSTTSLLVTPHPAVTNETVTLTAVITSTSSLVPPSGRVTFFRGVNPLARCAGEPVLTTAQTTTVGCQASFSASSTPEHLKAVFSPVSGSGMAGSSDQATLNVNRAPTAVGLLLSAPTVTVGRTVTYRAAPEAAVGSVAPTGAVEFLDGGKAVRSCQNRPLQGGAATCKVSYPTTGRQTITAVYEGDSNFLASPASAAQAVQVLARGTISSLTQWQFAFTPKYTRILGLSVQQPPVGATIVVKCHGKGCPFGTRSTAVRPCKSTKKHKCRSRSPASIDLAARFHRRRLRVGTGVIVQILRPGWIGKYYRFTIRSGRAPKVQISCLAPGLTVPGRGC